MKHKGLLIGIASTIGVYIVGCIATYYKNKGIVNNVPTTAGPSTAQVKTGNVWLSWYGFFSPNVPTTVTQ